MAAGGVDCYIHEKGVTQAASLHWTGPKNEAICLTLSRILLVGWYLYTWCLSLQPEFSHQNIIKCFGYNAVDVH